MVNVSNFETCFLGETARMLNGEQDDLFVQCSLIDDISKPVLFRGRSREEICCVASSLKKTLEDEVPNIVPSNCHYTTYRNNRQLSDLHETVSDTHIEIKLGSSTDLNIGLRSVKAIFEGHDLSFEKKDRKPAWRQMYLTNGDNSIPEIQAEQDEFYKELVLKMKEMKNQKLSHQAQKILTAYSQGVTNFSEIQKSDMMRKIYRFDLDHNLIWNVVSKAFDEEPSWVLQDVFYSHKRRLSLFFEETNSFTVIKLILNYKNSYKMPNGTKAPAKLGLGSPSFNGWIS